MNRFLITFLLLLPMCLLAQRRTHLGFNLAPLLINTVDLRLEQQLFPTFSLQLAAGLRYQKVGESNSPRVSLLHDYIHVRDFGAFFSIGGRIFNSTANEYEFPYVSFDLTSAYFKDVFSNHPDFNEPLSTFQGWKLGGSVSLGFVIKLGERFYTDLGLQLGYSPMRQYSQSYYLGGLGYTTFGPNRFSFEGAHFQPIVTLKYVILQDKRDRIHEQD
jgi:hypothetical protein